MDFTTGLKKVNRLVIICVTIFMLNIVIACCLLAVNGDVASCKTVLKDNNIICNKVHRFD